MGDLIFVQVDPSFEEFPLRVFNGLLQGGHLQLENEQSAWQDNIRREQVTPEEGNDEQPGDGPRPHDFHRSFSSLARQCMATATGMKPKNVTHQRLDVRKSLTGNEGIQFESVIPGPRDGPNFCLAEGHDRRRYTCRFDMMYMPHLIEEKHFRGDSLNSKMLIFRPDRNGNLQVIEISTTAVIDPLTAAAAEGAPEEQGFQGSIKVVCRRWTVKDGQDGEHTTRLKEMLFGKSEPGQPPDGDRGVKVEGLADPVSQMRI